MEILPKHPATSKSNHSILEVLEFCKAQDLPARVVGRWVWIQFDSKPSTDVRQSLKALASAGQNGVVNGRTVAATVAVLPGPTVLGTSTKQSA